MTIKKEVTTQQMFLPWPERKEIPSGEGWSTVRGAGFSLLAVSVHRDAAGFLTKYFKQSEKVLTVKTAKKKSVLKSIGKKQRSKNGK